MAEANLRGAALGLQGMDFLNAGMLLPEGGGDLQRAVSFPETALGDVREHVASFPLLAGECQYSAGPPVSVSFTEGSQSLPFEGASHVGEPASFPFGAHADSQDPVSFPFRAESHGCPLGPTPSVVFPEASEAGVRAQTASFPFSVENERFMAGGGDEFSVFGDFFCPDDGTSADVSIVPTVGGGERSARKCNNTTRSLGSVRKPAKRDGGPGWKKTHGHGSGDVEML